MTPTISSLVAWPGLHSLVRVSSVCPRRLPCHGASLGSQCCHPPSLVPASSHSCLQFLSCTCLKTVSEQISFILLRIPQELPVVLRVSLSAPLSLLPSTFILTGLRFLREGHTGITYAAESDTSLAFKSGDAEAHRQ